MSILREMMTFDIDPILRERFNLSINPFTVQELFHKGISEQEAKKHDLIFQDRRQLLEQIVMGIRSQASYKAVVFGERGVGKSSLTNLILYSLSEGGYLTMKIPVSPDDIEAQSLQKTILRELANAVITNIIEITGLNWETIKTKIQNLFRRRAMTQLEAVATLSFLFSADQVSFEESAAEKAGEAIRLGPQNLQLSLSSEVVYSAKALVSYARIPQQDFQRILSSAHGLVREFDYRGIILALDDADKLEDLQLELALLRLLRDAFYAEARYHLLVVCARDVVQAKVRNLFTYHFVDVLPRADMLTALDQMYRASALSSCTIFDYFDEDCLNEICDDSRGLLRDAILACSEALTRACLDGKAKVDLASFHSIRVPGELVATLDLLDRESTEWRVLTYLRDQGESFTSDRELQRFTGVTQSRLSQVLMSLERDRLLVSSRQGKKKMYRLSNGIHRLLED